MLKLAGFAAVAMILCAFLSAFVGDWLMSVWFVGSVFVACIYVYGNKFPTYLTVGAALAWTYVMWFTDLIVVR